MGSRMNWTKCSAYRKTRNNDIEELMIPINEMHDDMRAKKYAPLSMAIYKREKEEREREKKEEKPITNKQIYEDTEKTIKSKIPFQPEKISREEERGAINFKSSMSLSCFSIFMVINHKKFGLGRITSLIKPNQLKVFFVSSKEEIKLYCTEDKLLPPTPGGKIIKKGNNKKQMTFGTPRKSTKVISSVTPLKQANQRVHLPSNGLYKNEVKFDSGSGTDQKLISEDCNKLEGNEMNNVPIFRFGKPPKNW